MVHTGDFTVSTRGRGTHDVTDEVARIARQSGVKAGLANIFLHHTSASLILCENADPSVRRDLEGWLERLVQDGDVIYVRFNV